MRICGYASAARHRQAPGLTDYDAGVAAMFVSDSATGASCASIEVSVSTCACVIGVPALTSPVSVAICACSPVTSAATEETAAVIAGNAVVLRRYLPSALASAILNRTSATLYRFLPRGVATAILAL